jgi:uncharacterized protein YjbJ (UPF0337 family)
MVNQQTLQGNWNEIKGKLRSHWGQLTNDDVKEFRGDVDQLIGLIERKTGEARTSIEQYLGELTEDTASAVGRAAEGVRDYANYAAERIQEGSAEAAESFRRGYAEAERAIRSRPTQSVALCFGAGVLTGVLLGVMLQRR